MPIFLLFIAWLATGGVRVFLGSSTAPVAYVFFGLFWLLSLLLLAAAVRQLVMSGKRELKIESICSFAAVVSVLLVGLLGRGNASPVAVFVFLVSLTILLVIYGRRLRRGQLIHS